MGRKSITISDIAKRTGVSKTTVSRYLNGKYEFMSQQTRDRISKEISDTGFRPNRLANSLKTDCSDLIGVVMSDIMSSQTPHLLGSICDTCTKYGKKVVVVNSENDPEKERLMTLDLLDQRVEGLLVISGYNSDFYQGLDRERLPVVLADRVSEHVDMDSVVVNHAESTRHVVNYLLKQGYQRIVILQRPHINPYNTLCGSRQCRLPGLLRGRQPLCAGAALLRLQAAPRRLRGGVPGHGAVLRREPGGPHRHLRVGNLHYAPCGVQFLPRRYEAFPAVHHRGLQR